MAGRWGGSRDVSSRSSNRPTPAKNPRPVSWIQAYIAYLLRKAIDFAHFASEEFSEPRLYKILGSSLSSGSLRMRPRVRQEAPEDGIADTPLEAPQSLLTRFTFPDLLAVVGSPLIVRPGLAGGDHMQGVVELAVAGQREPVAHHLPARCLQRRRAGVGGEVGLGRETLHTADRPDDPGGQYRTHAEDPGEGWYRKLLPRLRCARLGRRSFDPASGRRAAPPKPAVGAGGPKHPGALCRAGCARPDRPKAFWPPRRGGGPAGARASG